MQLDQDRQLRIVATIFSLITIFAGFIVLPLTLTNTNYLLISIFLIFLGFSLYDYSDE